MSILRCGQCWCASTLCNIVYWQISRGSLPKGSLYHHSLFRSSGIISDRKPPMDLLAALQNDRNAEIITEGGQDSSNSALVIGVTKCLPTSLSPLSSILVTTSSPECICRTPNSGKGQDPMVLPAIKDWKGFEARTKAKKYIKCNENPDKTIQGKLNRAGIDFPYGIGHLD